MSLLFIRMHSLLIINDPIVDVINLHLALFACFCATLRWLIFKFKRGTKDGRVKTVSATVVVGGKKRIPNLLKIEFGIFYRTKLKFFSHLNSVLFYRSLVSKTVTISLTISVLQASKALRFLRGTLIHSLIIPSSCVASFSHNNYSVCIRRSDMTSSFSFIDIRNLPLLVSLSALVTLRDVAQGNISVIDKSSWRLSPKSKRRVLGWCGSHSNLSIIESLPTALSP